VWTIWGYYGCEDADRALLLFEPEDHHREYMGTATTSEGGPPSKRMALNFVMYLQVVTGALYYCRYWVKLCLRNHRRRCPVFRCVCEITPITNLVKIHLAFLDLRPADRQSGAFAFVLCTTCKESTATCVSAVYTSSYPFSCRKNDK
jgi:hypothetical protein